MTTAASTAERPPRSWLPRSLFGRNLLLIAVLILGGELVTALGYHLLVQMPRIERTVDTTRAYLLTLSAALERLDGAGRAAFIEGLEEAPQPALLIRAQPEHAVTPASPLVRLALARLQRRLGPEVGLAWSETPRPRLWMRQPLAGQDWWLGIDAAGLGGGRMIFVLAVMLGAGGLAMGGAVLIQRSINRPLDELAEVADRLADGTFPSVEVAGAPTEIARLGRHIENMASRLEAAEQERNLMLAGISHDLRTPLAKLRLAVEILSVEGEEALLQGMARNIAAADQVIDQFIDFARLGSAEARCICDPEELARAVVARFGDPRLRWSAPAAEVAPLVCRPVAVQRALANLVDNALKYGCGEVAVSLEADKAQVVLQVADHGPGIPETELERLRQPFARLEAARNGPVGAGLGLAIVERIARLEGGRLELSNRGGLVARLILPRSD